MIVPNQFSIKKCRTCTLRKDETTCKLADWIINPDEDCCPAWTDQVYKCRLCGKQLTQPVFEETGACICPQCVAKLTTCQFCSKNAALCAFDKSNRQDRYIQQQIMINGVVIPQTMKNPTVMREVCVGCTCYNDVSNDCMRDYGACKNYEQ